MACWEQKLEFACGQHEASECWPARTGSLVVWCPVGARNMDGEQRRTDRHGGRFRKGRSAQTTRTQPRTHKIQNCVHGVASFLGSWQFHSKSAHSTGSEGSSPYSQHPAPCPYSQSDQHSQPFQSDSLKTHFNIILLDTPQFSKWPLSFRFPHQNPVNTAPISPTCYMPHPSHSSWFDHPNIRSAVQITKLLIA